MNIHVFNLWMYLYNQKSKYMTEKENCIDYLSVCLSVCVCMYIYIYTYTVLCVCMCIYIYIYIYIHTYTYILHTYIYLYIKAWYSLLFGKCIIESMMSIFRKLFISKRHHITIAPSCRENYGSTMVQDDRHCIKLENIFTGVSRLSDPTVHFCMSL